jgi:uncharacterized membrane protein YfcA
MKKTEAKKAPFGELLKYVFLWSSAYFTIITLVLLFSQALDTDTYVVPAKFLLIFPFAVVMALGNLVIKSQAMKIGAKTILHCAMTILGAYVFLILPNKTTANPFVILLTFAAIYFIIATPILIVRRSKLKKEEEKTPYKSMFSK